MIVDNEAVVVRMVDQRMNDIKVFDELTTIPSAIGWYAAMDAGIVYGKPPEFAFEMIRWRDVMLHHMDFLE